MTEAIAKDSRVDVRGCKTAQEVLEKSGFGFHVELVPLTYQNPKTKKAERVSSGHRAVIRTDTGQQVAVVGGRYHPIQAQDFLSRLEPVIKAKQLVFVSAAMFDFGRVMVIEAELPQPIRLPAPDGKEDVLRRRVLWRNSHDGTQQINLQDFLLRQWCTNGATHILGMASHNIRHTSSAQERLKVAADAVAKAVGRFTNVERQAQLLVRTPFSRANMQEVAARLYPPRHDTDGQEVVSTRTEKARDQLLQLFEHGQGTFGRSAWDAVNALTEWSTHGRPVRTGGSQETQAGDLARLRTMWTVGDIRVRQGFEHVLAVAGIKHAEAV